MNNKERIINEIQKQLTTYPTNRFFSFALETPDTKDLYEELLSKKNLSNKYNVWYELNSINWEGTASIENISDTKMKFTCSFSAKGQFGYMQTVSSKNQYSSAELEEMIMHIEFPKFSIHSTNYPIISEGSKILIEKTNVHT